MQISLKNLALCMVMALTITGYLTLTQVSAIGKDSADKKYRLTILSATAQAAPRSIRQGQTGTVMFPIPGLYREQVPISFSISTEPAYALLSYKIRQRKDGLNWICEAKVKPSTRGAKIKWKALVLVSPRVKLKLPTAARPEVNASNNSWTTSTACVQSADQDIKRKARHLAAYSKDVESSVKKVISFTSKKRKGPVFDGLDAKRALLHGGSCTSRANLAAALLRAQGIPARTMSHLPTDCGLMYEHWLVEYWHPGVGWVWVEPTTNQFQPTPERLVVLAVSNADDEKKAFDPIHLRYVMPGAAYLSVCEFSKELKAAPGFFTSDAMNSAQTIGKVYGSKASIKRILLTAKHRFKEKKFALSNRQAYAFENRIKSAASSRDAESLAKVLRGSVR